MISPKFLIFMTASSPTLLATYPHQLFDTRHEANTTAEHLIETLCLSGTILLTWSRNTDVGPLRISKGQPKTSLSSQDWLKIAVIRQEHLQDFMAAEHRRQSAAADLDLDADIALNTSPSDSETELSEESAVDDVMFAIQDSVEEKGVARTRLRRGSSSVVKHEIGELVKMRSRGGTLTRTPSNSPPVKEGFGSFAGRLRAGSGYANLAGKLPKFGGRKKKQEEDASFSGDEDED